MFAEEWRNLPIEGLEHFQASNLGRVKGLDGHILRQFLNNGGNPTVQITNEITIHRKVDELVAICFIKGYQKGIKLKHLDNDKTNCRVDNIEPMITKDKEIENGEEWRKITIEGIDHYQVSNKGNVRNGETKKLVKLGQEQGYAKVYLFNRKLGKDKKIRVHRLVARCFLENYSDDLQVDHINYVRNDNRVENLRMVTMEENIEHSKARVRACKTMLEKAINQYNLQGKYLATYESTVKASKSTGVRTTGIWAVLHNQAIKAGEYMWRFYKGDTNDISPYRKAQNTQVKQYDLEGNFIREYESIRQAIATTGIQWIGETCRKNKLYPQKTYTSGGYIWRYA